ncbi:MAG: hypothetical protein ACXVDH_01125 [Nocardioides sp.]
MRFVLPSFAVLGALISLTACGGGAAHTEIEPLGGSASPTADPGEAATAAVTAYVAATSQIAKHPSEDALDGVATPAWASTFVGNYRKNVAAKGMKFIGTSTVVSADPTVTGSTARVDACVDGTHTFIVPKAAAHSGPQSQSGPRARYTYRLLLQDDRWLVDDIEMGTKPC